MTVSFGWHVGPNGNLNGIGDHWRAMDAARIPAFLKSTDYFGPCWELANIAAASGVPHTIIYRLSTKGQGGIVQYDVPDYALSPVMAAAKHWTNTRAKLPPEIDSARVWVEPINEVDKNRADWLGQFAVELAKLANGQGYKVTMFGWSSGEPEPAGWSTPGMLAYLRYCAANPGRAAVSLHEYSFNVDDIKEEYPHRIGRFTQLLAVCQQNNIAYPEIHLTEWGWEYQRVPTPDAAMADLEWAHGVYAPYPTVKGAAIWHLGGGFGGIANEAQKLIAPVTQFNLDHTGEVPPPQPPTLPAIRILKKPQKVDLTKAENDAANDYAWNNFGRTTTHSTDDMIRMLSGGNQDSYAILAYPDKASQDEAVLALQTGGYRWVEWPEAVPGNPLDGLRLSHILPYRYMLTSPFNAPRTYGNLKHEGCDYDVIGGLPDNKVNVLCTYDGIVDRSLLYGDYGNYVRVTHTRNGSTFYTRYAHLDARFVATGNVVKAGDPLGEIGATGNAFGEHVHFNLEVPVYGLRGYIVDWVVNPEIYMAAGRDTLPSIPTATTIDLLPYIRGDGRLYEVQTVGGGQERFQTQSSGNVFYQTKGSNFEELSSDESYIWRGLDISPGPAPAYAERPGVLRYYTAKEPNLTRARWCKRIMAIGETFTGPGHRVQFFYQDTCQTSSANSGPATNKTTLKAKHASKTWNGITVNDVVEMTNGIETWFFARGFGLVAWNDDKASSAISEVHAPGTRPDNVRATGCWS